MVDRKAYMKKYMKEYQKTRVVTPEQKERVRQYQKKKAQEPEEKKRKRDWSKKNTDYYTEYHKRYNGSKEVKARMAANKIEIPKGLNCQMCRESLAKERHHPDYNQPLKVILLCKSCHKEIHNQLNYRRIIFCKHHKHRQSGQL